MTVVACNSTPFTLDQTHLSKIINWTIPTPILPQTKYYGGTVTLSYTLTGAALGANPFRLVSTVGDNPTAPSNPIDFILTSAATSTNVTGVTTFPVTAFDLTNDRIGALLTARLSFRVFPPVTSVMVTAVTLTLLDTPNAPSAGTPGQLRATGDPDHEPGTFGNPSSTIIGTFPSGNTLSLLRYNMSGPVPMLSMNFAIPSPGGSPFSRFLGSAQLILTGSYAPTDERGTLQITAAGYDPAFNLQVAQDGAGGSFAQSDTWEGGYSFHFDAAGGAVFANVTVQINPDRIPNGINLNVGSTWPVKLYAQDGADERVFGLLTIDTATLVLHYCPADTGVAGTFVGGSPPPPGVQYSFTVPSGAYIRTTVKVDWVRSLTGASDVISIWRPAGSFWASVAIPAGNAGDMGSAITIPGGVLSTGGSLILGFLNTSGKIGLAGASLYSCSGGPGGGAMRQVLLPQKVGGHLVVGFAPG